MNTVTTANASIVSLAYIGNNEYYLTIQYDELIPSGQYVGQNKISTVKIAVNSDMWNLLKTITKASSTKGLINKYITVGLLNGRIQGFDVPTKAFDVRHQVLPTYVERHCKKLISDCMRFQSTTLQEHMEKFKTYTLDDSTLTGTVQYDNISAVVKIPNLSRDTKINNSTQKILQSAKDDNFVNTVGDLFIYELIKFIDTITLNEEVIEFASISTRQAVNLVESLPLILSNKIVSLIQDIRKYERNFTDIEHNGKTLEIAIDASFFNGE